MSIRQLALIGGAAMLAGAAYLQLQPADVDTVVRRAQEIMSDDPEQAERLLREVLTRSDEPRTDAKLVLCQLWGRAGRWQDVQELLSETDVELGSATLLMDLGQVAKSGDQDRLARDLWRVVSRWSVPEQPRALQLLFQSTEDQGPTAERLAWAQQLTELTPNHARAWWQLAGVWETRDQKSAAASVYQRAVECRIPERDQIEMRYRLLDHSIFLGDIPVARQTLDDLHARQIRSAIIDVAEARLLREEGHSEKALAALNRIWPEVGRSPRVIWLRGRLQLDLGNLAAAADDFQAALKSLPDDEILHFNLAEVYRRLGDLEKSAQYQQTYQTLHQKAISKNKPESPPTSSGDL